jgi:uncharacterized membrane protein
MLPVRRHEISRLEAFSDAVFAFALTLLVVSLDVPKSYDELMALMAGFVPFAASFALLTWIWYEHNLFFRRASLGAHLVSATVGAIATGIALFAPMPLPVFSGFTYFLMGPAHWVFGLSSSRRRRALEPHVAPAAGV